MSELLRILQDVPFSRCLDLKQQIKTRRISNSPLMDSYLFVEELLIARQTFVSVTWHWKLQYTKKTTLVSLMNEQLDVVIRC